MRLWTKVDIPVPDGAQPLHDDTLEPGRYAYTMQRCALYT